MKLFRVHSMYIMTPMLSMYVTLSYSHTGFVQQSYSLTDSTSYLIRGLRLISHFSLAFVNVGTRFLTPLLTSWCGLVNLCVFLVPFAFKTRSGSVRVQNMTKTIVQLRKKERKNKGYSSSVGALSSRV
jgi:hypothetical protein